MENLHMPSPAPAVEAPEFCFCGRKTIESHEYWYCSRQCAHRDALRSLDNPECHYRSVVRKAYLRAGAQELAPRRMMSVGQLRPGLSDHHYLNVPPRFPAPTGPLPNPPSQRNALPAQDRNMAGSPTLSQVTGNVLTERATAGEPFVAGRQDRPRWEGLQKTSSRSRSSQRPLDQPIEQIDLNVIPLPEPRHIQTLRRVPRSTNGLRNNIRKSVVALLSAGVTRKEKEGGKPERIFGHPVNTIVPATKESLPSHPQMSPPSANLERKSKGLRRSASFAGWDANPQLSDPIMRILEELREDCAGSFEPRSLFDEEAY